MIPFPHKTLRAKFIMISQTSFFGRTGTFLKLALFLRNFLPGISSKKSKSKRSLCLWVSHLASIRLFNVLWNLQTLLNAASIACEGLGLSNLFNHTAVEQTSGTVVLSSWIFICMEKDKLGLCICKILDVIIYRWTSQHLHFQSRYRCWANAWPWVPLISLSTPWVPPVL